MKRIIVFVLCFAAAAVIAGCGAESSGPVSVSLQISDRDVDVEYMTNTDLTVFGGETARDYDSEGLLTLDFSVFEPFEADDRLFMVSGTGTLSIYGQEYQFDIDEQIMSKVKVSESNTLFESILDCTADIGGKTAEISIDFVAEEDFSEAVATVSSGSGMLFFGDIFNDYLEYFNMVLSDVQNQNS